MPIYKGSTKLGTVYHGGTKIGKVYKGSTLVYSSQISVYNIYVTNEEKNGYPGFFLGEPGANKTVVGGVPNWPRQTILKGIIGTIAGISGTPGAAGSSLNVTLGGGGAPWLCKYKDNFVDSYGSVWYRYYYNNNFVECYVLSSPFHTTVGSQVIDNDFGVKAIFSSDASTITFDSAFGQDVYNAASTIISTFQYK